MCDNKVTKFIQRGYGYKEVTMKCGSTGTRGEQVLCNDCEEALAKRYPQGWYETPGPVICACMAHILGIPADRIICVECARMGIDFDLGHR